MWVGSLGSFTGWEGRREPDRWMVPVRNKPDTAYNSSTITMGILPGPAEQGVKEVQPRGRYREPDAEDPVPNITKRLAGLCMKPSRDCL